MSGEKNIQNVPRDVIEPPPNHASGCGIAISLAASTCPAKTGLSRHFVPFACGLRRDTRICPQATAPIRPGNRRIFIAPDPPPGSQFSRVKPSTHTGFLQPNTSYYNLPAGRGRRWACAAWRLCVISRFQTKFKPKSNRNPTLLHPSHPLSLWNFYFL